MAELEGKGFKCRRQAGPGAGHVLLRWMADREVNGGLRLQIQAVAQRAQSSRWYAGERAQLLGRLGTLREDGNRLLEHQLRTVWL